MSNAASTPRVFATGRARHRPDRSTADALDEALTRASDALREVLLRRIHGLLAQRHARSPERLTLHGVRTEQIWRSLHGTDLFVQVSIDADAVRTSLLHDPDLAPPTRDWLAEHADELVTWLDDS